MVKVNELVLRGIFPDLLKMADITPVHKKDDTSNKENYRPVSILPSISKNFWKKYIRTNILYFEYLNREKWKYMDLIL